MSSLGNIFFLYPIDSILINKKMPKGFKLETEENLFLSYPLTSKYFKKNNNNNNNNKIDESDYNKIESFFNKILNNEFSKSIYNRIDEPCLIIVEKNIYNNKYKNILECYTDLIKIYNYYLEKYSNEKDLNYKISKLKEYTEKNYKLNAPLNHINDINFEKKYKVENFIQMTMEEKTILGEKIGELNNEQLKGIIKIIEHNISDNKDEYFEFDIDKLSIKKCRELESYVKNCLGEKYFKAKNSNEQKIFKY